MPLIRALRLFENLPDDALLNMRSECSAIPIMSESPSTAAVEGIFIQKPLSVVPEDLSGSRWYFDFIQEKLERLKTDRLKEVAGFFNLTDDCLCELICYTITRALSKRVDPARLMKFAAAVNVWSLGARSKPDSLLFEHDVQQLAHQGGHRSAAWCHRLKTPRKTL